MVQRRHIARYDNKGPDGRIHTSSNAVPLNCILRPAANKKPVPGDRDGWEEGDPGGPRGRVAGRHL